MKYIKNNFPDILIILGTYIQYISVYLIHKGFSLHKKYGNNVDDKLNKLTKKFSKTKSKIYKKSEDNINNKHIYYINKSGNA